MPEHYGEAREGHAANGCTTDGGFADYCNKHINTLAAVHDAMSPRGGEVVVTGRQFIVRVSE